MSKIEYQVLSVPLDQLARTLNEWAGTGWSLHTVLKRKGTLCLIVERRAETPHSPGPKNTLEVVPIEQRIPPKPTPEQVMNSRHGPFEKEPPSLPVVDLEELEEKPTDRLKDQGWMEVEERPGYWQDPSATDEELIKPPFGIYTEVVALKIQTGRDQAEDPEQRAISKTGVG